MDKEKILSVLELVTTAIGTDYKNEEECKDAITTMLNEVNKLRSEIEGKPIHHYYSTVLEKLCYPQGKPKK